MAMLLYLYTKKKKYLSYQQITRRVAIEHHLPANPLHYLSNYSAIITMNKNDKINELIFSQFNCIDN